MVNITQPDTILFSGLPADTTLYHVNLTQGFIINAIEGHETEGSGALLINRPGHSRVTIRSSINEPIHCRIMDMSGRIVYESGMKCMACNPCLQITTGKDPVYILSISGASFSTTFKLTGGAQTDGFSIEEIACSSDLKSFRLHPSAGDFKYTPGDWIRFHTSKTGYYSNHRTSAPESGDTVLVWMSEPCPDVRTVTDIDGNVYQTVQIGSQCWMRENMKAKRYADGTHLVDGTGVVNWYGDMSKYWFDYDDDPSISEVYGRLYTANAATNGVFGDEDDVIQGICPNGWHVASDFDFNVMESFLGMTDYKELKWRGTYQGEWLREAGAEHWNTDYGSNRSGFTALPAGLKFSDNPWTPYDDLYGQAFFWTSTSDQYGVSKYRMLASLMGGVLSWYSDWEDGFSCRCVRNSPQDK
jgi:uncharacterized protein (TIGR02145 family)